MITLSCSSEFLEDSVSFLLEFSGNLAGGALSLGCDILELGEIEVLFLACFQKVDLNRVVAIKGKE